MNKLQPALSNRSKTAPLPPRRIAIVGIGNKLAGDDGAGIIAIERLRKHMRAHHSRVLLATLEGDLFAIEEFLPLADHFVFIDAVAGATIGEIVTLRSHAPRAMTSSFHQTDIGSTMQILCALDSVNPFPSWEIRGITIAPPDRFRLGLSGAVDTAVDRVVSGLAKLT